MKYIEKTEEPRTFSDWKSLANEDWQPTYGSLSGTIKTDVKAALMAEQGYLCCYCERRLVEDDSHIEHFRPQSDPMVDPLDFSNMLCSCQNHLKKREPLHCGNLKGDWAGLLDEFWTTIRYIFKDYLVEDSI
ncbi:MAG: retron system putative HNH endonuclease [Cyanobacteria bacterium P01_F01_bin.86]